MSTFLAIVTALGLLACGGQKDDEKSASVGEGVIMRIGDSVTVVDGGLQVRFEDVVRDSRCPPDVQCIRAGEAVVVLGVTTSDGTSTRLELEVPPGGGAETTLEGHQIRVVSLEPPASSGEPLEPDAYVIDLVVES